EKMAILIIWQRDKWNLINLKIANQFLAEQYTMSTTQMWIRVLNNYQLSFNIEQKRKIIVPLIAHADNTILPLPRFEKLVAKFRRNHQWIGITIINPAFCIDCFLLKPFCECNLVVLIFLHCQILCFYPINIRKEY